MRGIVYDTCSILGKAEPCFYCSHEEATRPYTRVEKDPRTGLFKPVGMGRKKIDLGEYCNNACDWVVNLHYCPSRWNRTKKGMKYELSKTPGCRNGNIRK